MITIGIDPGIAITGIGITKSTGNKIIPIYYGAIETHSKTPMPERLDQLYCGLTTLFNTYKPESMAVESLFFNKNVKTALTVGHARGIILLAGQQAGVPIFHYTPPEIKLAVCGHGRADKKQVQQMVKTILKLSATPKPDDVADGLAIAICHTHSYRIKSLT